MSSENPLFLIPPNARSEPWIQQLIKFLQEQNQRIQEQNQCIQEQNQLIQKQIEEIVSLKQTVREQKDEINKLKKTPKRPKFRPGGGNSKDRSGKPKSGINKESSSSPEDLTPKKVREEVVIEAENVPEGSRFKGYQEYTIQELELIPKDVVYKLEVWQSPNGKVIRGSLPKEIQDSHFGYQLRAIVHTLYAFGMTEPGLFEFVRASGIEISEGQIHRLLKGESEAYEKASEEILTAGMEEAPYIRTDDTGAKHQHKSGLLYTHRRRAFCLL